MRSVDLHVVPGGASSAPASASSPVETETGHTVQFYENDAFLAAAVADFIAEGLNRGQAVLVLAVAAHRQAFARRLRARGVDAERARQQGALTWCDADAVLARILVGGEVDADRFREEILPLLQRAELRSPGGVTRAYGELVDVLWRRGDRDAALRVEELWSEAARTHRFALLCGYAMGPFYGTAGSAGYRAVCDRHVHVVPTAAVDSPGIVPLPHGDEEGASGDEDEIVALRRRTRALAAEVAHRRLLERELRDALAERRRMGDELERSRRLLVEAERVARLGSWSACPATGECAWSEELWRMLGAVPDSLEPSLDAFVALVHPDDRRSLQRMLDRVLDEAPGGPVSSRSAPARIDVRLALEGGAQRLCEVRVDTLRRGPREPVVLHGTVLDVTEQRADEAERRALDARLLETQRLESVGLLAGGIAHDFNNLLTSIVGNADLLQASLPAGDERELVDEVLLAARRSADLTRQLLAYAGHAAFVIRPLDLSQLAGEVGALLRTAMPAGATLRLDVSERPTYVAGDRAQLTQVLMNFVTNAADSLPPDGGVVAVRVRDITLSLDEAAAIALRSVPGSAAPPIGACVRVEVTDTGVGMTAEVRARMFEPFFSTKFTGRGLGLAATLGILRAHRAAVEVASAPGQGTTVRVWLPRAGTDPAAVVPGGTLADPSAARRRILVVDDEESVRNTLTRLLRHLGYAVSVASGAREALTVLGANAPAPDLAIVDLTMPDLGGEATAELLAVRWPELPVIFTSGYGDSDETAHARAAAAVSRPAMLAKPFDVAAVRRLVAAALQEELDPATGGA
jgi:signal transduction histidine kinase/ActR/RegA family two-component response regulator